MRQAGDRHNEIDVSVRGYSVRPGEGIAGTWYRMRAIVKRQMQTIQTMESGDRPGCVSSRRRPGVVRPTGVSLYQASILNCVPQVCRLRIPSCIRSTYHPI